MKLKQKDSSKTPSKDGQGVLALILAPTRELALQVHKNLQDVAKAVSVKVSIGTVMIFYGVMYSGVEYVCVVALSAYPHPVS